ncbi:MAG: hypothetical protein ACFE96_16465 [Candidatus Hermodarchaeota archaeon]
MTSVNVRNTKGKIPLIQEEGIVVMVTVVETAGSEDGIKPNQRGGSFI